jgi:hypothetical protein
VISAWFKAFSLCQFQRPALERRLEAHPAGKHSEMELVPRPWRWKGRNDGGGFFRGFPAESPGRKERENPFRLRPEESELPEKAADAERAADRVAGYHTGKAKARPDRLKSPVLERVLRECFYVGAKAPTP